MSLRQLIVLMVALQVLGYSCMGGIPFLLLNTKAACNRVHGIRWLTKGCSRVHGIRWLTKGCSRVHGIQWLAQAWPLYLGNAIIGFTAGVLLIPIAKMVTTWMPEEASMLCH